MMMKSKFILSTALAATMAFSTAAQAIDFHIELGDRGYYTHGARYWNGDYEYVWIPGHHWHGRWIHGYYRRGEHRRHHGRHFRH